MSDAAAHEQRAPRWLPWLAFGLLVLPFHPLWVDFEQVRRGLLLLLAGALLIWQVGLRGVPAARGERFGLWFVLALVACAVVQALSQWWFHGDDTPWSFSPWLAAYRVAHWLGLVVLVRVGAAVGGAATALPLASLLLATSVYGLLQRLGVAEWQGYGVEREPVSTLGNLNVASEWTAVAAVGVAVLWPKATGLARGVSLAALFTAGAYLVVNHSRSGLVALPVCLALLAVLRRREQGWLPALPALVGAALGVVVDTAALRPEPADVTAARAELERGTKTLQVRFHIAAGATRLFAESPVFGKGPGQFMVEYPRHRSQEEIEASSFGRQFATEVRTVHDDWLELLVDGGAVAVVWFALWLFALQRGRRDKAALLPLFALMLLMLVRAPVGNAPAAAIAFWLAGSYARRDEEPGEAGATARRPAMRLAALLVGAALLPLGLLPVAGNTAFVPYVRAQRDREAPPVEAASAAAWWMPYEPRFLQVEARERLFDGDLQRAAFLAANALRLRPFSPPLLLLLAEVLARGGRPGEALKVAQQGLELDPAHPELRVLVSAVLAELGDVDRAIEAVVVDPHPRLRAQLEHHFADLALRAGEREPKQARRFLIEFAFVAFVDRLGLDGDGLRAERDQHFGDLRELVRKAGREDVDARPTIANALIALELDKPALAAQFSTVAEKSPARLTDWQAALLGEHLDRLRELPGWAPLLPAR